MILHLPHQRELSRLLVYASFGAALVGERLSYKNRADLGQVSHLPPLGLSAWLELTFPSPYLICTHEIVRDLDGSGSTGIVLVIHRDARGERGLG